MKSADEMKTEQRQQRATCTIFFIAGLAMSAWAPLIPFIQAGLNINDARLGILLFCIAAGSMSIMPFIGKLIIRYGYRHLILFCCVGFSIDLPFLLLADNFISTALVLLLFGALNGLLDVTMNAQAVVVERESGKTKMSGFHGFYSIGSISGAGLVSLLLAVGMIPLASVMFIVALILLLILMVINALRIKNENTRSVGGTLLAIRDPTVCSIAILCFFLFLCEGAMLDWSAVLMHSVHGIPLHYAGLSFTCYSLAVAFSRFTGDRLIARWGKQPVLLLGNILAVTGLLLAIWAPSLWLNMCGFMLTGLGIANLVPLLFSAVGNLSAATAEYALPTVTLIGYAGLLIGPALIGFGAQWRGLALMFSCLTLLLLLTGVGTSLILHSLQKK